MKSISFFLRIIAMVIFATLYSLAQTASVVTLEGKQFKLNGANFYPMVMNYAVELTMPNGSGTSGWPNSYLTPYVEYGVNNGPNGGPGSYIFECANKTQCASDIVTDWTYLSTNNLKFNTIRVAGFYPKYQSNGGNPSFFFNIRETGSYTWQYLPIDLFTPNDPGLDFVLDRYEELMQLADQTGMKLIFNMIGQGSDFTQIPGPDNDEIDYYDKFLDHLAARVAGSSYAHTVLAFDLWNEPCYFDISGNKTKENTCEIISQWYATVKGHGTTPLVTIGTCGSNDVLFYDPAVLKVDFHSLHVYPEWRDFEDRTDPTIQQRAWSRIYDELYWFNKISPVPWIIGEVGFAASINLPLSSPSLNGANGTLTDQASFTQAMLAAVCNSGGSGFSWWWFQDGWHFDKSPHEAHWGMLERGFATGDVNGEKPMVNVLRNYSLPTDITTCGPSPVDETTLQTYNPNLTYFNPFQHPSNPSKTIKGYVVDQDGNPIANAYVGGHTFVGYDQYGKEKDPYYKVMTNFNGYFEIIPESTVPLFPPLPPFYGELHTLFLTVSGGERLKYSSKWPPINASNVMPLANTLHSWTLNRTNFTYNGDFHDINVSNGESRDLEASNTLTISDVTIQSGSMVNIRAKKKIQIKHNFHVTSGALTHIYCENTTVFCSNYNGYIMQYKMPGTEISNDNSMFSFIDLEFKKISNSLGAFTVIPNPANATFKIRSEKPGRVNIILKNLMGQRIFDFALNGESDQIDVSGLARGVYFLVEIETGNVKKLILQ